MPSASYRLNSNLLLRQEFYGGLIHSRHDGRRWEVTREDAIFLWVLDGLGNIDPSVEITRRVHGNVHYLPVFSEMLGQGIVIEGKPRAVVSGDLEATARAKYNESLVRDYLRAPLNLSLYPRMACQLSCKFCYVSEEKWQKDYVEPGQWIDLMRQARESGVPFISFLGGDPSLYPHIADLVRACDDVEIKGSITTNGLHLKSDLFGALAETRWITPTFSVQSLDNLHKVLTGRDVDKTLSSIKCLCATGKECNVNLVYTEQGDEQLIDLVNFCAENGVSKLSVAVFVNINNAPVRVPFFSDYRRLHEKIGDYIARRNYPLIFQVEGCQLYTAYPDIPDPAKTDFERLTFGCEAGNGRAEIMHDGVLLPCALLDKNRWGSVNALEIGLQKAWDDGRALKRIRKYKNLDQACNACSYGSFCNGGCPAMNEKEYGTIEEKGDSRCEIRNRLIETPRSARLLPLAVARSDFAANGNL